MVDPPTVGSAATYPPTTNNLDCIEAWDFLKSSFLCTMKDFNLHTLPPDPMVVGPRCSDMIVRI
jgi:hypothetical protein